jgi:hypothetical protein
MRWQDEPLGVLEFDYTNHHGNLRHYIVDFAAGHKPGFTAGLGGRLSTVSGTLISRDGDIRPGMWPSRRRTFIASEMENVRRVAATDPRAAATPDQLVSLADVERVLTESSRLFSSNSASAGTAIGYARRRICDLPPVDLAEHLCPCHGAGEVTESVSPHVNPLDPNHETREYPCPGPGCLATPVQAVQAPVVDGVPF